MDFPNEIDLDWLGNLQPPPPPPHDGPEIFGAASRLNYAKRTDQINAWLTNDPDSAVIRYRDAIAAESGTTRSGKRQLQALQADAQAEWTAARNAWESRANWTPKQPPKPQHQRSGKW